MQKINEYGDYFLPAGDGHGADIASQRADELDEMAIARVQQLAIVGATPKVRALDLGAGRGAQALRLLRAGAGMAVACDLSDFSKDFYQSARDESGQARFLKLDLRSADWDEQIRIHSFPGQFDVIVFQRTLHYFEIEKAKAILQKTSTLMKPDARLYLSASGISSELGQGYDGQGKPLSLRFAELAPHMQSKHGIHSPVCLYTSQELSSLCEEAGLGVLEAQESRFGNIKVVAGKT